MKNIIQIIVFLLCSISVMAQKVGDHYYLIPKAQKTSYGYLVVKAPIMNMNFYSLDCEECGFDEKESFSSFPLLKKNEKTFGVSLPTFNLYQRFGKSNKGIAFEIENYWNIVNKVTTSNDGYGLQQYRTLNNFSARVGFSKPLDNADFGVIHLNQKTHQSTIGEFNGGEIFTYTEEIEKKMLGAYLKVLGIQRLGQKQDLKCIFDLAAFLPYSTQYYSNIQSAIFPEGNINLANRWIPSAQASLSFTSFDISSKVSKPIYWWFEAKGNYYNQKYR